MLQAATGLVLFSVLVPARMWFPPGQPMTIAVQTPGEVRMLLTDFTGKVLETTKPTLVPGGGKEMDLREMYPTFMNNAGAYVLYAVPPGENKTPADCIGTPLVITIRSDKRPGARTNPMVANVEPLRYAVISTDMGDMTAVFYYNDAPHTVSTIQRLAQEGFYDGLTFHRIVPGFVIQGGDPGGDGTGGPGFHLEAEFNDRLHEVGTLSMARNGDKMEQQGMMPRCEYANSAGSQFFICLARAESLDRRYTAFGKIVDGFDTLQKLGAVPLADPTTGRPQKPPVIKHIEIKPVTAQNNPYVQIMLNLKMSLEAATGSATRPVVLPPQLPKPPSRIPPKSAPGKEDPAGSGKMRSVVPQ